MMISRVGDRLGRRRLAVGPRVAPPRARRSAAASASCRRRGRPPGATSIVSSPTTTRLSPSSRPQPRYSAIPRSSSHGSWELSSRSWMISSRRSSTRCDVELAVDRLGRAGDAARLGQQLARPQQRLGRHAGPERALAADLAVLDDRDLQPGVGQPARRHLAAGPGADHHHVEAAHPFSLARDRLQWECIKSPGDDRLRRGRFVGVVASRGAGGLVKPRQKHKCEVSRLPARCLAETRRRALAPGACAGIRPSQQAGQCPRNARLSRPGGHLIRLALRNPAGVASGGRDPERRTHS